MNNTGRAFLGAIAVLFAVPVILVAALAGGGFDRQPAAAACGTPVDTGGQLPSGAVLTAEMLGHARTITTVGQDLGVNDQGIVIALAAALVESGLRNLDHGDRDSLGLFQQRPSQGWGTPEQVMDPTYAAQAFYLRLMAIPGWENLEPGDAAQLVQRSAYPDRYHQRIDDASSILAGILGADPAVCGPQAGLVDVAAPLGGTITVDAEIADDLAQLLADAEAAGIILGGGGYRSPEEQIALREAHCGTSNYAIYQMPASDCTPPTARPGTSLHESGLAIDFTCYDPETDTAPTVRRGDPCDAWLTANAATYGLLNLESEAWHYSPTGG
jgi:LAS superfamily LD-carboxypeptidase LdcB